MRTTRTTLLAGAAAALLGLGLAGSAGAQSAPTSAIAYINPDTGAATENPDVESDSSCDTPDGNDLQALGNPDTGENNVHVDACLRDGAGAPVDTQAAFDVIGPAVVSGCPDPDMDGPKTAVRADTRCVLSGFEAANSEYHVRVVGTSAGIAQVTFCADPEGNGCSDTTVKDTVIITFQGDAAPVAAPAPAGSTATPSTPPAQTPVGAVAAGEAPSSSTPLAPIAGAGALALAASLLWSRRARA